MTEDHPPPQCNIDATGKVELEILNGSRREEVISLTIPGTYEIGSRPFCAIHFDPAHEPFVSGLHCELRLDPERAEITDLDSSNGTFLDGHRIEGCERVYCGDILELGYDGPRLRFDAKDEHYVRDQIGRSTVVIRRSDLPAKDTPPPPPPPRRSRRALAVATLLVVLFAGLLVYRNLISEIDRAAQSGASLDRAMTEMYTPGVFLIALRVTQDGFLYRGRELPRGRLLPLGTAWAFDTAGRLATNGHMLKTARKGLEENYPYVEIVLVQNETQRIFFPKATRIHPKCDLEDMEKIVYDVGIIELTEPVPVAFPIVAPQAVEAINAGETVWTLGFPIEHVGQMEGLYGYDSPEKVVATLRQGVIQRITDAVGQMSAKENRRLVHLELTTSGGQSGSPIFTRDGTVIAILSATAVAQIGRSSMPHPGRYTYSVRSDSLIEMITDTDAASVPVRRYREDLPETLVAPLPPAIDFRSLDLPDQSE